MILKALYDYYHRCGDLPAPGMELKEIGFIIVISNEGKFIRFEDRRIDKDSAQTFLVKRGASRSSDLVANYLYDNSKYVFGYPSQKKIQRYFNTFKTKIEEIYERHQDNKAMKALYTFYSQDSQDIVAAMRQDPLWETINKNLNKKYSVFSFIVDGDEEILASKSELIDMEDEWYEESDICCLITGKRMKPVEITTATMIPGSLATAKLVGFKEDLGYDSYGKTKGLNAPISWEAEFAYTTALNAMLSKDSHNKFMIGTRTFLFWASSDSDASKKTEEGLFSLFGRFEANEDDPNRRIELVRDTFMSVYNGKLHANKDDKFFILGLAPNSARIAVVYWSEQPLREFAGLISKHFEDMEIVDIHKDRKPYAGLHSMLGSVTLSGKSSDAAPNLPDAVVKSIFQGLPYPMSLFQACIRRIRAEQSVTIVRAAIIKAYLNRLNNNNNDIKIKIMLDKENQNQGYLCGRLFAVLEKLQDAANKQDTIRSSYMNAASSTPSAIFPTILKLSNSHYSKLAKDRRGLANFFDNQKKEIIAQLKEFPDTLDLNDQGKFFIGYYHQKNYKENNKTEE